MSDSLKAPKRGPMSDSNPDYLGLYEKELQGDFYGADYYRPPRSDIDSAIIYRQSRDVPRFSKIIRRRGKWDKR